MSHIPVNHPMRTFYRFLAALAGLYILIFGIVAYSKAKGSAFAQHDLVWALGLRSNAGFALISIVAGVVILITTIIGRNVDRAFNYVAGFGFMAVGVLMLTLIRTDANFLGFSMANCIASFIIGTVLFASALYGRAGSAESAAAEEHARQHR